MTELHWTDEFTPFNPEFQDKFYAAEGGFDESRYVFLEQNELERRFEESEIFSVGELGFGTGLNFLTTWDLWRKKRAKKSQRLHFISCELYPLSKEQMERALRPWTDLKPLTDLFLKKYFGNYPQGIHRICFDEDGVSLTLLIGDAVQMLKRFSRPPFGIDAWFLDGFAPRKNPEMWSESVFQCIRDLSVQGSTFSTYTSAGFVRRGLEAVGFKVEKFKGFARKKEMLKGNLTIGIAKHSQQNAKKFLVIGAGLAGTAAALALSKRSDNVTLIDSASEICAGASGNEIALGAPVITALPSVQSRYSIASYLFVQNLLKDFPEVFLQKAAIQFPVREKDLDRFERGLEWLKAGPELAKILTPEEASEIAGIEISSPGIYFPDALILKPKDLCQRILEKNPRIKVELNKEFKEEVLEDTIIILANASSSETKLNRGQILSLKSSLQSQKLKCALMADKYIAPEKNGSHIVGATYDRENLDPNIREQENDDLRAKIAERFPALDLQDSEVLSSRVSFRATTEDKLPYVGKLSPHTFMNLGMGSRGLVYSFLSAEILASEIFHEPIPLETDLLENLSPQTLRLESID